jgi:hypothetical protein
VAHLEEDGMAGTYQSQGVPARSGVAAGRLWAGGLATALVAALIATIGILGARGLLDISILAPKGAGVWGDASTAWYAVGAAIISLAATGLMHGLIAYTPRPMRFFSWILALGTIVAVLAPFVPEGALGPKVATAALNLLLGVAIGTLVAGTARSAMHTAEVRPARNPFGPATTR